MWSVVVYYNDACRTCEHTHYIYIIMYIHMYIFIAFAVVEYLKIGVAVAVVKNTAINYVIT